MDVPASELLALNPAVLKTVVPDGYSFHVPKGKGNQLMASLQLIPSEHRTSWRIHRVVSGETLAAIGKHFGVTSSSIATANQMEKSEAAEGDWLMIPAVARAEAPARRVVASGPATSRRRSAARRTPAKSAAVATRPVKRASTASDTLVRTAQR
jgi:spore germination protein YaaH